MCQVFSEVTFYRGSTDSAVFSQRREPENSEARLAPAMEMANFQRDPKIGGAVGAGNGDGEFSGGSETAGTEPNRQVGAK